MVDELIGTLALAAEDAKEMLSGRSVSPAHRKEVSPFARRACAVSGIPSVRLVPARRAATCN